MADLSGTQLSEEKEADNALNGRRKRPWDDFNKSRNIHITPELPETLGFYDLSAVRREEREQAAEPSLTRFFTAELTRGYFLEHNEAKFTECRERLYTCMRVPKELEKLMIFGFFLCLDAFLYIFTLLPLRVFLAVLRLLTLPCCGFSVSRLLQPAQVCDMLKGLILVLCFSMMHFVDYSMMYHLIRGQSVIKLYLIYNMLEVADRLFSSFGQDILDTLYWTATEPKERKRDRIGVIPHFLMAVCYVFLHAILVMVQASTLNVAFNTHNKSLLTIMMSSNFVEIKANVFKRVGKKNLFQMSNSDIKERFTSYVLLLIVCLRNLEQFEWKPDYMWVLFPNVVFMIISEVAVDIIKHAFVTKFNDMPADIYTEYRACLAFDLISSRQKDACTDYSDSGTRRIRFIPLPSAILVIKVLMSSVKVQGALSYTCVFLFYLGLFSLKVLNSIVLLGKSYVYVQGANLEDELFEGPFTTPSSAKTNISKADQDKCPSPPVVSEVEHITATHCSPPLSSSSSSSVTTQPTPRTDLFPTTPPAGASPEAPASRRATPPPEPEQPTTPLSKEEDGEAQGASELRHRTPNEDQLEIDRFTICGDRID